MKRTKKLLVGCLATLSVLFGALGLVGCGGNDSSASSGEATEIEKVYAQYVVYAEAQGQEPLSYEEWLATIKGEKGDTGAQGEKGAQGVGIEKVEFDENGDLLITFTDGTKQTVEMPSNSPIDKGATENLHYQKIPGKDEYCVVGLGLAAESDIVISSTYNCSPVTTIGYEAFRYCSSLTSIVIPDSVTLIGDYAFYDCYNLTSIEISDGVTSIGYGAFFGCESLTYNVKNNLKYLGNEQNPYLYLAYVSDTAIASATIESACKFIGNSAFYECSSLTSIVIPDSVTSIGNSAFYECSSLTSIVIPDSVTSIGNSAFYDCDSLTSVTIGNSVTSIGVAAFGECGRLTSVTIGNSVTSIDYSAFSGCESLTSITFNGTKAQWNAVEKGNSWNYFVPATKVVCSDGEVSL